MEIDRERLDRAIALTRASAIAKIKNARVVPHWLGAGELFWYRRDVADGLDFVIVDAASGCKRVAFERGPVADALSLASGVAVDARHLQVKAIELTAQDVVIVTVTVADRAFVCTLGPPITCSEVQAKASSDALAPSPDGKWAVFVRDSNLWLLDNTTGREMALTEDGMADFAYATAPDTWRSGHIPRSRASGTPSPFMVTWSPDSRRLIAPRIDQRHVTPYPYIESAPLDGSFRPKLHHVRMALVGERPEQTHWHVFDVTTGTHCEIDFPGGAIREDPGARNVLRTWWKSDGESFLQLARTGDLRRGFLFEVNAASGSVRVVVEESTESGTGLNMFNAGGYGPPCVRVFNDNREAVIYSVRGDWGHLCLYEIATGRPVKQLTDGEWLVRDILRLDEASRRLYFVGAGREEGNPYHRSVYRIDLDGVDLRLLTPGAGDHLLVDPLGSADLDGTPAFEPFSPSGKHFVCDVSAVREPTRSEIRNSDSGELVATFEHADASELFAAGYRPPEEVCVRSTDGAVDLHGLVYRPSDYDSTRTYPVIDIQYGSPAMAVTPRSFLAAATYPIDFCPPSATAELGFVVVVVDGRGTPFRSQSFSRAMPGYLAHMGLADHVAFIREVGRRDRAIDLDRVGISGVSFGGWTSIRALLEYPYFFRAGVAGAPPGGFHSMYYAPGLTALEGRPTYKDGSPVRPNPSESPANFVHFDSAQQIARMKGKLLLVMGEHDENVLPGSTLQLFDAAMKADADVDLIYVPNATHVGFYTPYVLRKVWEFMLRELAGQSLPRGAKLPGMS